MKYLIILLALTSIGCAQTKWVRKEHATKSGIISYRNDGGFAAASLSRADSEIKGYCGGGYVTLAEGESSTNGGMVASGNMLIPVTHNWIYLEFKCSPDSINVTNN